MKTIGIAFFLTISLLVISLLSSAQHHKDIDSLQLIIETEEISKSKRAVLISAIGSCYYKQQDYPSSILHKKQALEIFKETNDKDQNVNHLEVIGILYAEISDYNSSLKYFFEAINYLDNKNTKQYNSLILNIGTTYFEARDFSKALEYLNISKQYFEKNLENNTDYLQATYTNIGTTYGKINVYDSAFYYFDKSLILAERVNSHNGIGGALINIGDILEKKKDFDKALYYYTRAITSFELIDDQKGIWHSNLGIASIYKEQKKYKKAIFLFNDCIDHFIKTNDFDYLSDTYLKLSYIYKETGDLEKSFDNYINFTSIKDSIYNSEIHSKMSDLELQYKIEKISQENDAKIKLIEKENELSRYKWITLSGLLIIILIIIITLFFRHKSRKKLLEIKLENEQLENKTLESNLKYKNKELENFALHIAQKNEFLDDIKSDLINIKKSINKENQKELGDLNLKISQSLRVNKELENFHKRIDEVNRIFLDNLAKKFSTLTEKEKRLCVLLKLNLASKEIALLNNITEGAVTMARYRLRKKLILTQDDNLVDFLQKFD